MRSRTPPGWNEDSRYDKLDGVIVMRRVKGIYEDQVVRLLEKVEAKEGSEVEVMFADYYQEAKARQILWLKKGFHMGKLTCRNRAQLHDR